MRRLQIKFPYQVRIFGWDFGSSARAMNQMGGFISTQADLRKDRGLTFFERKQMSTKTSIKRIALVAVSALGFGMLSVVSANAAAATVQFTAASSVIHRTDAAADSTFTIEAGAALTAADGKDITLAFTRNGVAISGVPSGISINWNDSTTALLTDTAGSGEAGNVLSAELDQANLANGDDIATVTVARTMAPGKYTVSLVIETSYTDTTSLTFYVATAPTAMALDAASYALDATDSAPNASLTITDAQGNPSYLKAGEALDITLTTSLVGATKPTFSPAFLDSASYDSTTLSKTLDLETSSATAGSYTLKVANAAGLSAVAAVTATITVGAAPSEATGLSLTSRTYTNSNKTTGGADADFDATDDGAVAAAGTNGVAYLSTAAKDLTFKATTAATSGIIRFTIASNGSGLPAGVTAGATDVAISGNATDGYSATFTVSSTAPSAGYGYTVTAEAGANDYQWAVTYQVPVAAKITTVDSLIADGNIGAVVKSSTSVAVKVTDQFGQAFGGAGVTYSTTGRQASNGGAVSATDGTSSYSWTDASTATVAAAATDSFTATLATPGAVAGYVEDSSVGLTVNYASSITVSTVALVANYDAAVSAGASTAYDTAISTAGTTKLTVRGDSTIAANGVADQIVAKATVKDSLGNAIPYALVTFSGSNGVYFANAGSASLTSTESNVPVLANGVNTLKVYADANGVAYVQARFTILGTGTVTATAGGISSTAATVNVYTAGAIRSVSTSVSENIVSATVKDGFGNVVSGATVTFSVSGGTFLTGANSTTGTTDVNGVATAALASGAGLTVKSAISGGQSAADADADVEGFAAGVASSSVTAAVGNIPNAAVDAAKEATAQSAQNAKDIAALTALVEKLIADKLASDAANAAALQDVLDVAAESNDNAKAAIDAAQVAAENGDAATAAAQDATEAANAVAEQVVTAQDFATEATDAANAATDAANAAAEAADNATAAAQDAQAAVTALATQLAAFAVSVKAQITTLTNLVIKIQKKVNA